MPDIRHVLYVKAPIDDVFSIVSTPDGLVRLWGAGAIVGRNESLCLTSGVDAIEFIVRRTRNRVNVQWNCEGDNNEMGDTIVFSLAEAGSHTQVKFFHARWPRDTHEMTQWNTLWGAFLMRLKADVEGGSIAGHSAPGELINQN
tara:strand:+ start:105 stop:536 length:432 start_codon:yes stop_codon:yes gene_type:complete